MQLAERIKTLAPRVAAVVSLTFAVAGCVILAGGPSYLRSLVAALPADGAEGDAARRFAGDLVAIFGLPLGVGVYGTLTRAPSRRIWSLFAALTAALAIADATILSMRGVGAGREHRGSPGSLRRSGRIHAGGSGSPEMRVRRAALCVASAIGLLAAAAQADPRHPASDSEPVVDARVERVVPGPAATSGRYRIVIVATESSLDVYFDRVTFAEQEGEPPTSTPLKYIAAADLDPDRSVIREIEVKEWKTSSDDVVLLVNDSHRCTLHLTRDSYTASCR